MLVRRISSMETNSELGWSLHPAPHQCTPASDDGVVVGGWAAGAWRRRPADAPQRSQTSVVTPHVTAVRTRKTRSYHDHNNGRNYRVLQQWVNVVRKGTSL